MVCRKKATTEIAFVWFEHHKKTTTEIAFVRFEHCEKATTEIAVVQFEHCQRQPARAEQSRDVHSEGELGCCVRSW